MTAELMTARFRIDGMDCAHCAAKVEGAARRIAGVAEAEASVMTGALVLRHHAADLAAVESGIAALGYAVRRDEARARETDGGHGCGCGCEGHDGAGASSGHDHAAGEGRGHHHDRDRTGHAHPPVAEAWWRGAAGREAIAVGLGIAAAGLLSLFLPHLAPYAYAAIVLGGLYPIARRALAGAVAGAPLSIETLLVIAAGGALVLGAFQEAATVVFLFLVGEMLEGYAAARARGSIRALSALLPETALVETATGPIARPAASLAVGERVMIRPGDRVPCDGTVVEGTSDVDLAMLTGESLPATRTVGDRVFAGTVNGDGLLRVVVDAPARDTAVARIVRLVTEAQESKAPVERFVNRFARRYTPAVVAIGALVAAVPPLVFGQDWSGWIYRGLAVLLIGCPCALVISTPAAVAAALSAGARRGLLIKGGAVLERLGDVSAVAFDKTGTLTAGAPTVADVVGLALSESEVLRIAAALEATSSHPLASAILARAAAAGLAIEPAVAVAALPGRGLTGTVAGRRCFLGSPTAAEAEADLPEAARRAAAAISAEGKTVCVLVREGEALGLLGLGDAPRADAAAALADLRGRGIATVMLTGDNPTAAGAVGAALGIDVRAGLLPEDKQRIVRQMRDGGAVVAKVGDGVNDAPALAAADVGIAMGGGADVALEAADAALLHGRVGGVAAMIDLSRRTMANIRQNIAIALGLKALFLATTVAGLTGLWPAILADTGATVLVTANALRLLGGRTD